LPGSPERRKIDADAAVSEKGVATDAPEVVHLPSATRTRPTVGVDDAGLAAVRPADASRADIEHGDPGGRPAVAVDLVRREIHVADRTGHGTVRGVADLDDRVRPTPGEIVAVDHPARAPRNDDPRARRAEGAAVVVEAHVVCGSGEALRDRETVVVVD